MRILAATALVLLVATGCGSGSDAEQETTEPEASESLSVEEEPVEPDPVEEPAEEPSDVPTVGQLPDVLTSPGRQLQTGGQYEDPDGYVAKVDITLYKPTVFTEDDLADLDATCAEGALSEKLGEWGSVDGAVGQAFELSYSSPDKQFPFPLQDYLQSDSDDSMVPNMYYTGSGPDTRASVSCAVQENGDSARYIGFATMLAPAKATPNDRDRRLVICDPDLYLSDPLYEVGTGMASRTSWVREPDTPYGPSGWDSLTPGWSLPVLSKPFASRC